MLPSPSAGTSEDLPRATIAPARSPEDLLESMRGDRTPAQVGSRKVHVGTQRDKGEIVRELKEDRINQSPVSSILQEGSHVETTKTFPPAEKNRSRTPPLPLMAIRSLADLRGGSTSRSPRDQGTSSRWRYPTEPI